MWNTLRTLLIIYIVTGVRGLIVPEEIPSLLSLVYSNIPPIKKGTDSRLGWGFRLGDHADFQVMVELGPQIHTRPLGNEKDKNVDSKRQVPNNLRNYLWAQNQLLKQKQKEGQFSNTDGGKWLKTWSTFLRNDGNNIPLEGAGEIDASLAIPPELEELYGKPTTQKPTIKPLTVEEEARIVKFIQQVLEEQNLAESTTEENITTENLTTSEYMVTTEKVKTTTDWKDALDNVELE